MTHDRTYLIIPAAAVPQIDFDTVYETSAETMRYSVDGSQTFVKWEGEQPSFVDTLTDTEGPYTHTKRSLRSSPPRIGRLLWNTA